MATESFPTGSDRYIPMADEPSRLVEIIVEFFYQDPKTGEIMGTRERVSPSQYGKAKSSRNPGLFLAKELGLIK